MTVHSVQPLLSLLPHWAHVMTGQLGEKLSEKQDDGWDSLEWDWIAWIEKEQVGAVYKMSCLKLSSNGAV